LQVVYDEPVGDHAYPGASHVHPTIARLDDRLFVAWSRQSGDLQQESSPPQVVIEEYAISFD